MIRYFRFIIAIIIMSGTAIMSEAGDIIEWKLQLSRLCFQYSDANMDRLKAYKAATLTRGEAIDYETKLNPNYSPLEQTMMKSVLTSIYQNLSPESVHTACVKAGLKYDRDGNKTAAYEKKNPSAGTVQGEEDKSGQKEADEDYYYKELNKSQSTRDKNDQMTRDKEDSPLTTPQPIEKSGQDDK